MIARKFFDLQRFANSITNRNPNKVVEGTDAGENIWNYGINSTVIAGAGDDHIGVLAGYVTVTGGAGNDTVDCNEKTVILYTYGDGDDTIQYFNSDDTLKIVTSVGYSTLHNRNKLYINFDGSNSIVLTGINDTQLSDLNIVSISGSGSDNSNDNPQTIQIPVNNTSLLNRSPNKLIIGTDQKDYVSNYGLMSSISTGNGDDAVWNGYADFVNIDTGAGNDDIKILSGETTITGGLGNDIVNISMYYGENTFVNYTYGDGDDTIDGFNADDTLKITSSVDFSTIYSGGNLLVTFDESNSIVLTGISESELGKLNIVSVSSGNSGGGSSGDGAINTVDTVQGSSGLENLLKNTSFDDLKEAVKTISKAVATWGDSASAGLVKGAISYIEDIIDLYADKKDTPQAMLNSIFKASESSAGMFNGIYKVIDKYVKNSGETFDENIFGDAAKTNFKTISLVANILGLAASIAKASDKLDEKTIQTAIADYVSVSDKAVSTMGSISALKNALGGVEVIKAGPWSAANVWMAVFNAGFSAVEQGIRSHEKYYKDGKWDANDTAELLIDVSMAGLYGISHTLTLGLDDVIFGAIDKWTGGDESIPFHQKAAEGFKTLARDVGNGINEFIRDLKEDVVNVLDNLKKVGTVLTILAPHIADIWLGNNSEFADVETIDGKSNSSNKILAGNSNSNSIVGGNGQNSIWGGAGNNTLTGGTSRDQFWYTGSGKDIVTNFTAGRNTNSDVIVLRGGGRPASLQRTGGIVSINLANGNSISLQTGSSSNDDVITYSVNGKNLFGAKIADSLATSLTYSTDANYFQLGQHGKLVVNDSASNSIWLSGSHGQRFANVANIDASTSTGNNALAGNSSNNQITAGQGNDSLWGGSGSSSDTLIGGNGADTFFYGKNDGADVIQNASSNDTVNLYNVRVSDISSAKVNGNTITANFKTGGSLQINGTSSTSSVFKLASGSRWQYNGSRWQKA